MSLVIKRSVVCDHCGKSYCGFVKNINAAEIRAAAAKDGWRYHTTSLIDTCPECATVHAKKGRPEKKVYAWDTIKESEVIYKNARAASEALNRTLNSIYQAIKKGSVIQRRYMVSYKPFK